MPKKRTRKEQKKAAVAESSRMYELGREWGQRAYIPLSGRLNAGASYALTWHATADSLLKAWPDAPGEVLAAYDDPGAADPELIRGLCFALAVSYLDETQTSAEQAVRSHRLEVADDTHEASNALPAGVREEYEQVLAEMNALVRAAERFFAADGSPTAEPDLSKFIERYPKLFTPGRVQALRAAALEAAQESGFKWFEFTNNPPGLEQLKAKALNLLEPHRLNQQQREAARSLILDGEQYFGDWLARGSDLTEVVAARIPEAFEALLDPESAQQLQTTKALDEARKIGLLKQGKAALAAQFVDERRVRELHRGGAVSEKTLKDFTDRDRRLGIWSRQTLWGLLNLAEADGHLKDRDIALSRELPRVKVGGVEYTGQIAIPAYGATEIAERLGYPKGDDNRARSRERNSITRALSDLQRPRWLSIETKIFEPKAKQYRSEWIFALAPILGYKFERGVGAYLVHASVFAEQVGNFWMLPVPGVRYERALAAVGGRPRLLDEYGHLEEYCRFLAGGIHARPAVSLRSADAEPIVLGDLVSEKTVREETLFRRVGWAPKEVKKRGPAHYRKRLHRALDFCAALNDVLESWSCEEAADGHAYTLQLRDPGANLQRLQYTLLEGDR